MDLGEPIDLMGMLKLNPQPGPPPALAFDQALAQVMDGQESLPTGGMESAADPFGKAQLLAQDPQFQLVQPGLTPPLHPMPELPLQVNPEGDLPEETEHEELYTPVLPAPVTLDLTLPPSASLSFFDQGSASSQGRIETATPFVAPPLAPRGAVELPESPASESDFKLPLTQGNPPELSRTAVTEMAQAAAPPPVKGLHQRMRDRIQHLAPQGTRVLSSDAGQAQHPLMELERAAGARWNQLAQLAPAPGSLPPKTKKSTLGILSSDAQPTTGAHVETPSFSEPELPEASAAPKLATQVPMDTPEEWVPIPKHLKLEIDAELTLSLSAHGRELELSLDGSAEALAPLDSMENELRDNLDRDGWTLREFSTRERGRQGQREAPPKRAKPSPEQKHTPRSRPVPRGAHINRVA